MTDRNRQQVKSTRSVYYPDSLPGGNDEPAHVPISDGKVAVAKFIEPPDSEKHCKRHHYRRVSCDILVLHGFREQCKSSDKEHQGSGFNEKKGVSWKWNKALICCSLEAEIFFLICMSSEVFDMLHASTGGFGVPAFNLPKYMLLSLDFLLCNTWEAPFFLFPSTHAATQKEGLKFFANFQLCQGTYYRWLWESFASHESWHDKREDSDLCKQHSVIAELLLCLGDSSELSPWSFLYGSHVCNTFCFLSPIVFFVLTGL